jgi:hypothetical protein
MHVGIIPFIPGLIYKSKWYKMIISILLRRFVAAAKGTEILFGLYFYSNRRYCQLE